jgi:hypothetical protein
MLDWTLLRRELFAMWVKRERMEVAVSGHAPDELALGIVRLASLRMRKHLNPHPQLSLGDGSIC